MLLDDAADLLSTGGVGTVGSTSNWGIYRGLMPPSPDKVVVVYETGGLAPVHSMNSGPGLAVVERPRLQVVVRSDAFGYSTGRQKAHDCYKLLDGLRERTINSTRYLWMGAIQAPFLLQRDENNRPVIAFNVDVFKVLSTA